jgi:hypothetical protein
MDPTAVVAVIITAGSLWVAVVTSRSAKDATVTSGFVGLTSALQAQVNLQGREIKEQGAMIQELQNDKARRRQLLRTHEFWDQQALHLLRASSTDPFPDPPPLDIWD